MVDMSRSMLYNGCFPAAKRVALALDSLIRGKYPARPSQHHRLLVPGAGAEAGELPTIDWNEYNYGTNMQHGFQLARQILGRQKGANRQIIIITDGEPTAHFDNGHVRFSYPPTPRTFQETLREVVRCTRDGITINTFMLERVAVHGEVRQRPDARSTPVASSSPPRTAWANTSWSITSPTSASSWREKGVRQSDAGDVTPLAELVHESHGLPPMASCRRQRLTCPTAAGGVGHDFLRPGDRPGVKSAPATDLRITMIMRICVVGGNAARDTGGVR